MAQEASIPPSEGGPIALSSNQRISDATPPKSNPPERHRGTDDEIERRRTMIILIRENLYRQKIVPDQWHLLDGLREFGYHIDRDTLRRDIMAIDTNNEFVKHLATVNYNKIIEDMFDGMALVVRGCDEVISKKWTMSKIITTEEQGPDLVTRTVQKVVTDELAAPRLKAYEIKGNMLRLLADIFKGGIIDAGLAIAQEEANNFKHEFEQMRLALKQKDDLLEELKSQAKESPQEGN